VSALEEIDTDIWVPFSRAYDDGDAEAALAILAPDFVWVQAAEGIVEGYDGYAARIRESFADLASREVVVHLAFRFTERLAGDGVASERGVYRMWGGGAAV
jgi:ketosteroid isomerase-like protein